uniref:Uncharacterized protein n=1 Tax=Glypta fumiferanae TaxID=389681 RepID=A0A0F6Y980_9HYME|nr:hypothetical protein [Glypta fumiferanae]
MVKKNYSFSRACTSSQCMERQRQNVYECSVLYEASVCTHGSIGDSYKRYPAFNIFKRNCLCNKYCMCFYECNCELLILYTLHYFSFYFILRRLSNIHYLFHR